MIFQAHKGVSTENPENTMPAFKAAIREGYGIIELDVAITADREFVILHDKTINRTARMSDGSTLTEDIALADITYKEALKYDFGIRHSEEFRGTDIPLLKDVLALARSGGVKLKIDNKHEAFSDSEREAFYVLLSDFEDVGCLTCKSIGVLRSAAERFRKMHFHYDGKVTGEILDELSSILPKERLTVWLPLRCKKTSWVKTDFATPELATAIKQRARLGIWILSDEDELAKATELGAEVIETNGELKPSAPLPDMHTHSEMSHDSACPIRDMLKSQQSKGATSFAVTDHFDTDSYTRYDIFSPIKRATETLCELKSEHPDMTLLSGVEISEGFWHPEVVKKIYDLPLDVVIGSVHLVRYEGYSGAYSAIDFGKLDEDTILGFLDQYFDDVLALLETTDFDILAHLTCPLRYINGKYHRGIKLDRFREKIREILTRVIASGRSLEVNTSSYCLLGEPMPPLEILAEYKALGGELITLGSDAHVAENASFAFDKARELLKSLGFESVCYYEKRKIKKLKL